MLFVVHWNLKASSRRRQQLESFSDFKFQSDSFPLESFEWIMSSKSQRSLWNHKWSRGRSSITSMSLSYLFVWWASLDGFRWWIPLEDDPNALTRKRYGYVRVSAWRSRPMSRLMSVCQKSKIKSWLMAYGGENLSHWRTWCSLQKIWLSW